MFLILNSTKYKSSKKGGRMKVILLFFIITINYSVYSNEKEDFFRPVINELIARGVDSSFVYKIVNHKSVSFNEKYVKINVTGYMNKTDYSHNYNDFSINKSKSFLNKHLETLKKAEMKYNVPKEVITSILWVETRTGNYLGDNHIPSVFLSTAMANQEKYIKMNTQVFVESFSEDSEKLNEYIEKINQRANKKTNWAINELIALYNIYEKLPISIFELKGSWAGAFGMSQFLPSSFNNWAVDGNDDGVIDLFNVEDAIFSVANYLKTNGWNDDDKSKRKAVFHYNNSNDYVDAVLTLANKIIK
jgi:membrane-bound lytic murein transglycosylase B